MLEHPQNLSIHVTEDVVQNLIREKLLLSAPYLILMKSTYNLVSLDALFIQIIKLRLALVEVIKIGALHRNPCMRFVNLDCELVLDPLYDQVLSHRAELIIDISIIDLLGFPLAHQQLESLMEDFLGAYLR